MVADVTFLFNDWEAVARVLFIAVTGYLTLIVLLRVSGQRTLAQMSSVDLVIMVTIGSAFGRVLTARQVALVEVIAAFAALVALQALVAYVWERHPGVRRHLVSAPAVLYYRGEMMGTTMRKKRLRRDDLRTAVRQSGLGAIEEADVILLESNGAFAVIPAGKLGDGNAIGDFEEMER